MKKETRKILVGMSGGVDSAVAVALLKYQGFQVEGLFLQMHGVVEKKAKDLQDAENICKKLDIPLRAVDARDRFRREVVKHFLDEYAVGRTPNPCVFCNENFKFKILLEEADKAGMEYVATGHYAHIGKLKVKSKKLKATEKTIYKLETAKDKSKDQSYFLYRLGQKELARIIFPLGEYEKSEVRTMAKEFGLGVSEKKESQDVCFMTGLSTEVFLKKNLKLKKGKIINEAGEMIGEHDGVALYTIGQRKGINIGGPGPYYVIRKDLKKNQLVVSSDLKKLPLFFKVAILEKVHWTVGAPKLPLRVLARSRYRNPLNYAIIKAYDMNKAGECSCIIEFDKPEKALASGQSVVFYGEKGEVIGGGIIKIVKK